MLCCDDSKTGVPSLAQAHQSIENVSRENRTHYFTDDSVDPEAETTGAVVWSTVFEVCGGFQPHVQPLKQKFLPYQDLLNMPHHSTIVQWQFIPTPDQLLRLFRTESLMIIFCLSPHVKHIYKDC